MLRNHHHQRTDATLYRAPHCSGITTIKAQMPLYTGLQQLANCDMAVAADGAVLSMHKG